MITNYNRIILFTFLTFIHVQLFSQCDTGFYSIDPSSAITLNCPPDIATTADFCAFANTRTFIDVAAGTQVCVVLPQAIKYSFETCLFTNDDTFVTLFDTSGNVIGSKDNGCGIQTQIDYTSSIVNEIICIQVESITMGVCDGTNSTSSNYTVKAYCSSNQPDYVQEFNDAALCQDIGFTEIQTLTSDTGLALDSPNIFSFNTGASSANGVYSSGSVTLCAQGDLDSAEEIWQINKEDGTCVGGLGSIIGGSCSAIPFCTSFNFDYSEVSSMVADGVVHFEVFDFDNEIGAFCDTQLITLELTLCNNTSIPTMGEWGLITLGLLLLSLSVVAIKQNRLVLHHD